ncbi:MAG: arylsulfatase [Woeseiaceae bacterium]|nr:arylsulfatase [Woeseiaceae bacterium]
MISIIYILRYVLAILIVFIFLFKNIYATEIDRNQTKPNILLIVADDLGWSDLGSFGGEITTPNLDTLAYSGIRLTNFHTAPTCSPTRSMLLTGTDSHLAGLGNMEEELGPNQIGEKGYEGYLNNDVVTFATLLKDSGYRTMMAGKWHLGASLEKGPESRGFQDVFVIANGISNHFKQERIVGFETNVITKAPYREHGKSIDLKEPFYSSELYTNKLISYIKNHQLREDINQPFFAYAAYSAPHWPLQAPDKFIEKYKGKYDSGYGEIRRLRLEKLNKLGLINIPKAPISELWPQWNELDLKTQNKEAKRMEVYAGMVEALDYHIGRMITYLKDANLFDNTIIIFMSDNGAEGNDPSVILENASWIPANFDNSIKNMGRSNSHISYGPKWAEVSSTPFKGFKGFPSEGGLLSPAIISYKEFKGDSVIRQFASVMDIAPTILDIANIEHPQNKYSGRNIHPIKGQSILPMLINDNKRELSNNRITGWELFNRRAVRAGSWKITWIEKPYGKGRWVLYDLKNDPLEEYDLATTNPAKLKEMIALWDEYEKENGVIIDQDLNLGYSGENFHFKH